MSTRFLKVRLAVMAMLLILMFTTSCGGGDMQREIHGSCYAPTLDAVQPNSMSIGHLPLTIESKVPIVLIGKDFAPKSVGWFNTDFFDVVYESPTKAVMYVDERFMRTPGVYKVHLSN